MALFFEYRGAAKPATKRVLRDALAKQPPPPAELELQVNAMAAAIEEQAGGSVQPKMNSFIVAAVLLAALAALALWAERGGMAKAPDQLWTAFQTVLGVIVGLLGGEAAGMATAKNQQ